MAQVNEPKTWLDKLSQQLNIDIDCMDPAEARKLLPFKPVDQTSNQRLVYERMIRPENRDLFLATVKEHKEAGWEAILTKMSALLCSKNIENIQGRVLLQSSAFAAYDTEKIVAQAQAYAAELEGVGIGKDRFCIKIPCTGPALSASPILLKEGIRTLGTSLFSVAQAIAASQAGCLSISPYYNLPWYHSDPSLWPDVEDPGLQHPMTPRMVQIMQTYERLAKDTGKQQPMLKPASFKSAREAMVMGELGCQHATIPEDILLQLSIMSLDKNPPPGESAQGAGIPSQRLARLATMDPLAVQGWDGTLASTDTDYLSNNGEMLDKAIEQDEITRRALHEALEAFKENELQSKAAIEEVMRQV